MFDNPVFVVILLVIVAALGAAAGFFAGRAKGQDMARGAKESDLNEAKAQIEADKQDISNLNAAVVQYRTQAEGFSQQLTYLKSQLAQAQRAEEMRVERERQRAAEEANRRQAESARKLQEQSKVLSA
ncbi:DNA recombination protein RmuC, partial [Enterococcus durans]|nr:DNA recombination protein RmuC [Enterococcus durans]